MPAQQGGQVDGTPGHYRLRWYDQTGKRQTKKGFKSKSEARRYFREKVEPTFTTGVTPRPDVGASGFIKLYLERHASEVTPRTIRTLTERLRHFEKDFGLIAIRELEGMVDEISAWYARQPEGVRYGRMQALRQVLAAAERWGYCSSNPAKKTGKNRQPAPSPVRVFSSEEIGKTDAKLPPAYRGLAAFGAATGLRPSEWQALERKDIDRNAGVINVRRKMSMGNVTEVGKTSKSRRQVPLSPRALSALDSLPARLDTSLVFPSRLGGVIHLDNFRYRVWDPAVKTAGVKKPATLYDLRDTYASNQIAAGISLFELATIMGTSMAMIERHYGKLLDGAASSIAARQAAWEASGSFGS